jgi:hypothetical protein
VGQLSTKSQICPQAGEKAQWICPGSTANIPEAEVQRSIERHKESPQRPSRSTGIIPVRLIEVLQRQRLLISTWGRSSVSRNGENSPYGSTRGPREGRYENRIEDYGETCRYSTDSYSRCTEVLLYKLTREWRSSRLLSYLLPLITIRAGRLHPVWMVYLCLPPWLSPPGLSFGSNPVQTV